MQFSLYYNNIILYGYCMNVYIIQYHENDYPIELIAKKKLTKMQNLLIRSNDIQ